MTTEVDFQTIFASLESQSARLNEASDNANQSLAAVEARLVRLNIGLELWHTSPIDSTDSTGNLGPHETSSRTVQVLGFARVDGKWCLAVKPMRLVSGFYEGDTNCPFENRYLEGPTVPLLKASRATRIAGLAAIPDFLVEIGERMAATVSALENAASKLQPSEGPEPSAPLRVRRIRPA